MSPDSKLCQMASLAARELGNGIFYSDHIIDIGQKEGGWYESWQCQPLVFATNVDERFQKKKKGKNFH